MRQNSIKHGQIFNFTNLKNKPTHARACAHTNIYIYIYIYGTALQTLPLPDKSFSEIITGKVFKFCFINLPVKFGCFCLWMISRNWWGFDNFNYWAHCSHICISIIQLKLLFLTVSFCENITKCACHKSPSVDSLSLSL